jgi:hypothetical protein
MRWNRGHRSEQLEDRRSQRAASAGGSAVSVSLLGWLFRRFGIAGLLIGGAALYFLGAFGSAPGGDRSLSSDARTNAATASPEEERMVEFVSFVLDDAQETWQRVFGASQGHYTLAKLVLFRDATRSGCGMGESAMGPFYCPADQKVYLDLSFFDELHRRFGAPGDFAQAYVIAHELGHHVQHLRGDMDRVHRAGRKEQAGEDSMAVRLELQADCYAGVWGHSTQRRDLLEAGDIEEALKAATVIGDDALQRQASGVVRPETFTHGTSAQRARWFRRGMKEGDPEACDTFAARSP